MAAEKRFENKVKRWLESLGVYPLGTGKDKMTNPPCGYYEKRWGGGYSKAGLPDMHIVVNSISVDVELKASVGRPSELQKHNIVQINQKYLWSDHCVAEIGRDTSRIQCHASKTRKGVSRSSDARAGVQRR